MNEAGIAHTATSRITGIAYCTVIVLLLFCTSQRTVAGTQFTVYSEPNRTDSWAVERDDTTVVEGLASDLVRAVFSELGYSAKIKLMPWSRVIHSVRSEANTFAINMTRTPSREEEFHWIGMIRPIHFKLWGLSDRAHELPRNLKSAKHFKIVASRGDVVSEYLESKAFSNLVYTAESSNTWELMLRNRIDLIAYTPAGMRNFLIKYDQPNGVLTPMIDVDEISTAHYLVMSKNSDPELVELFTRAFQKLVDYGIYREIIGPTLTP